MQNGLQGFDIERWMNRMRGKTEACGDEAANRPEKRPPQAFESFIVILPVPFSH